MKNPLILEIFPKLFDSTTLSKRDAFGLKPASLTPLENVVGRSSPIHEEAVSRDPVGSARIEALWRLDLAAPEENASLVDFAAYEVRILGVVREAIEKPQTEDAQGRNGLHCLAVAIFARLKYLFSGLLETSAFSRRRGWTRWTLNDQAETTSRAQLARNAWSQAANYTSLLLDAGVDLNSYNSFGNTVLMDFVAFLPEQAGNLQTMEILQTLINAALKALLKAGARISARDADGRDAVTILTDCLANTGRDAVASINYEGCLKELLDSCDGFTPVPTATSEWCLPHRESTELDYDVQDSLGDKQSQTTQQPSEQLALEVPSSEAVSFQLDEDTLKVDPFKLTLRLEGDAATRLSLESSLASETNEEADCTKQIQSTYTDSLSPDLNGLTDDMCKLVLSRAFGMSMDDVSSPEDLQKKGSLHSGRRDEDDRDDGGSNSNGNDGGRDRNWDSNMGQNAKRTKGEVRLSCPFRKRNPLRFNVRDHLNCATQSFQSITLVKKSERSIRTSLAAAVTRNSAHSKRGMIISEVSPDQICQTREAIDVPVIEDPENGITPEIAEKLRDRRLKVSVTNWAALWQTLFPADEEVKSDEFEPIIEADEVKKAFERNAGRCASALQKVSSNMILDTASITHQELGHNLWGLFQSFIDHTLQACRDMLIGSPVYTARRELLSGLAKTPLSLDSTSGLDDQIMDHSLMNSLFGLQASSASDAVALKSDHRGTESLLAMHSSADDSVLFPTRESFGDERLPPPEDTSDHEAASEFVLRLGDQYAATFEGPPRASVGLSVSGNQCSWCSLPTPCECLQAWTLDQTLDVFN
ncbi:ankyrin repeat protein [Colletotrichum sojae]|uniref:Ankyrin repeat protein n=1 Tax=Colletotrichum sojae TaxID=2175907 RepID=A0A8H6IV72_9PEZI|nr:ankyrin repeat protein [Colletotrichum sojae]